jgi:uncharacterized membrane protein
LNLIDHAVSLATARNATQQTPSSTLVPQDPSPPPASSPVSAPKAHLLCGKELWILGALLVLALIIPCIALSRTHGVWQVVAYAALTVGVVHAGLFAWLWWRYRAARTRALADARLVLGAKVNTQLMLIMASATQEEPTVRQRSVQMAAEEITQALKTLGEESLHEWHQHHDEALAAAKQGGLKLP